MPRLRKQQISIQLHPEQLERLKLRADRKGLFVSEYARDIISKELTNN
tara:strand:- start:903 stop:1046 length:144 start_codon:yes stop_codon:yes gene_type:complete